MLKMYAKLKKKEINKHFRERWFLRSIGIEEKMFDKLDPTQNIISI